MEAYDEFNQKVFREDYDNGTYICCNCGKLVSLESSYSVGGKHLVCNYCLGKIARLLNTSRTNIFKMLHNMKED